MQLFRELPLLTPMFDEVQNRIQRSVFARLEATRVVDYESSVSCIVLNWIPDIVQSSSLPSLPNLCLEMDTIRTPIAKE
jgi:hypothetical protein